jgi:uncharacterized protein
VNAYKALLQATLNAPSLLSSNAISSTQIILGWTDNSSNETGFKIERKIGTCDSTTSWTQIALLPPNTTSYIDSGLSPNTTYAYQIRAYNGDENSSYSICTATTTKSGSPTAPSNLSLKAKSSTQIAMMWKDNSGDESGFKIEQKTGGCNSTNVWTQVAIKPANSKTHTISGLSPNTTYAFRIRAYQTSFNSNYSNCASAKTGLSGTPPAPSNLKATSISSTTVNLSWADNSTNETGFRIYRRVGTGAWALRATIGANLKAFNDYNAINNYSSTTYQYYIVSYNAYGNSPLTYIATVPYQPTDFTVMWGTTPGTINLTWTDQSYNETGFEIYRKSGECSSAAPWAKVVTLGANRTAWTDIGLTGNMYCYQIRSFTKTGIIPSYGYSLPPP